MSFNNFSSHASKPPHILARGACAGELCQSAMVIKPPCLRSGDHVGVAAPASAPVHPDVIDTCARALEHLGFKPKLARHVRQRWGYLAGSDQARAADLMELFADDNVRAIICVRGGYGCARIAPLLDYRFIKTHPKIFAGYSDVTTLHCAFLKRANLVSFHAPMLAPDFAAKRKSKYSLRSFLRTVSTSTAPGTILEGYSGALPTILHRGTAFGPLVGGNLSVLSATLGTPYEPPLKDSILFLEEVDEAPYRIDRMLTQFINSGKLRHIAGIAVGTNSACIDPRLNLRKEYRQKVQDVFTERLTPLGVPVVYGLPFGHVKNQATLPVGAQAKLDGQRGDLIVMEPAVVPRNC